eukprot:scaffold9647_cov107-Isochrysis_galbana.AAC.3
MCCVLCPGRSRVACKRGWAVGVIERTMRSQVAAGRAVNKGRVEAVGIGAGTTTSMRNYHDKILNNL